MTPYEVSAMVFMLMNILRWSNWLLSEIYVNAGSYDERLLQVLPSCMKRCGYVDIKFLDVPNHELMKVVPFLKNVAVDVWYPDFGVAVDSIGNAISNTSECKLQHLTYSVAGSVFSELPKDIINGILEFSHVLETVTVSFPPIFEDDDDITLDWIDLPYVNDVNKRISDGLMGKLQAFVINLGP